MHSPYDEMYLECVQNNLGFFIQVALRDLRLPPDEVQRAFLASEVPGQIERGNPNFLAGQSGYELALRAFPRELTSDVIAEAVAEPFYPEAEYWSGWALAFCQWKSGETFAAILSRFPLERFLAAYPLMHEADVTKMADLVLVAGS